MKGALSRVRKPSVYKGSNVVEAKPCNTLLMVLLFLLAMIFASMSWLAIILPNNLS